MTVSLLCISNGHGEDVIACEILGALRRYQPAWNISALPISGEGNAYRREGIELIGPTQTLPSGGFLNQDAKQLARDLKGGLLSLTRSQLSALNTWKLSGDHILAVGDIVPLLFAYFSKRPYSFLGTAKSEYWLRDEQGKLPASSLGGHLSGWSGSVYLPWERWLMRQAKPLFVRDQLTAKHLQTMGLAAVCAGNPMMDGLKPTGQLDALQLPEMAQPDTLKIVLLPGSRPPEAYENWNRICGTIPDLQKRFAERKVVMLSAIAPSLSTETLQSALTTGTWHSDRYPTYRDDNLTLVLINDAFSDCIHIADVAIATAGTAAEQVVGLGKPAFTLPGPGPQFTQGFATVQSKMLGDSVQIVDDAKELVGAIAAYLSSPQQQKHIAENGRIRMGAAGAGDRIAQKLINHLNPM